MSRFWKASMVAALAAMTVAPAVLAQKRVTTQPTQQRTIIVRRYYAYDPFFWDRYAWYHGYGPYNSYYPPTTGEVKLKTERDQALVYVDGGFAGKVKDRKRFDLPPGTHKIELRDSEGKVIAHQTVNVIVGKTLKLDLRG